MLCVREHCFIAMDSLDDERTNAIARNWHIDEIEGAVELWRCPTCGRVMATEMTQGVRKDAPILVVTDEVELPRGVIGSTLGSEPSSCRFDSCRGNQIDVHWKRQVHAGVNKAV